jgi:hypothetical protein
VIDLKNLHLTVSDMPPDPDIIGALLDAAQKRHNLPTRSDVWRAIGENPKHGRGHLTRGTCTWPVYFTLRQYALFQEPKP